MAAADEGRAAALSGQGEPETVDCGAVSPNYFDVFGISPQLGRSFLAADDQPDRKHVLILSHALWAGRYG
jgi:hypothetical protein